MSNSVRGKRFFARKSWCFAGVRNLKCLADADEDVFAERRKPPQAMLLGHDVPYQWPLS